MLWGDIGQIVPYRFCPFIWGKFLRIVSKTRCQFIKVLAFWKREIMCIDWRTYFCVFNTRNHSFLLFYVFQIYFKCLDIRLNIAFGRREIVWKKGFMFLKCEISIFWQTFKFLEFPLNIAFEKHDIFLKKCFEF